MKLTYETNKTLPEMTIEELDSLHWRTVELSDLVLATGRELCRAPLFVVEKYCTKFKPTFDIMTDDEWLQLVQKCQSPFEAEILLQCMITISRESTSVLYNNNKKLMLSCGISEYMLVHSRIIPITETTILVDTDFLNSSKVSLEERVQYLKNSNYLYELYWDHYENALVLTSEQMKEVGLSDLYKEWSVEDCTSSSERDLFYSTKYEHIVGKESLTWDHVIAIMNFDKTVWNTALGILNAQWNTVSPIVYIEDPKTLLNPKFEYLEV